MFPSDLLMSISGKKSNDTFSHAVISSPVFQKYVEEEKIKQLWVDGDNLLFMSSALRNNLKTGDGIQSEKSIYYFFKE